MNRHHPDIRLKEYGDFFNPVNTSLDLAAAVTESYSLLSRNIWRKLLLKLGDDAFREQLYDFWSDLNAGYTARSRAHVLTARLNRTIQIREGDLS